MLPLLLHCACCCQVKLLVEEGGASPSLMDRWEQTPLDEARRVGALPVVEYLAAHVPGEGRRHAAAASYLCCWAG
jgi:hypothetical protein